jgi:hypothetical protein
MVTDARGLIYNNVVGDRVSYDLYTQLDFVETRYYQSEEGADLVDFYGNGPDLTYVSGFGVNQIFDFSPLSDDRWNKNAYIGNAFALPEYYDFPYSSEIYFDTSNPYHWKIKDCHYRYYEEQADSLTNISFAKLTYNSFGYGVFCTTSGTAYNTNTDAYGIWEFKVCKSPGTLYDLDLISLNTTTQTNSYSFQIRNVNSLRFRIFSAGAPTTIFETASGYVNDNTDYYIRITRNSSTDEYVTGAVGTFAIYIKGGAFGSSYILADATGGIGTNPVTNNTHTTSAYTLLDLDLGDQVRNYTINSTLQDFNDFTQSTGTYEIDNLKSSDELLLYLEGKGLDCTTSGVAYQASTDAYGEWEFRLNKPLASTINVNQFISSLNAKYNTVGNDGYMLYFSGDERVQLDMFSNGSVSTIFRTAPNYVLIDTDYTLQILRNSVLDEYVTGAIGTFAVYIKGGSFGSSYVLVDVTGGSGTNPVTDNTYTTSAYTVLDLDAGDNIANYSINGTLLDTRNFTQTTGEYVVTSELEDPELTQIKGYVGILPDYYGDELYTDNNAISDPSGVELNSTGTLNSADADTFQSQSSFVSTGNYAIEVSSNIVPANRARLYEDLNSIPTSCEEGLFYQISFDVRHVGIGGLWVAAIGSTSSPSSPAIAEVYDTDISFENYTYDWQHDLINTRYFGIRELSGTEDGGVYLDNLSIKQKFSNYYKNEE